MSRLLAVGLGYSAAAIADRLAAQGWQVAGTSRSEKGLDAIRARAGHVEVVRLTGRRAERELDEIAEALVEVRHRKCTPLHADFPAPGP